MKKVSVISGRMAPLPRANVDTDQIIPKQFLKGVERSGLGPYLFYDWARTSDGHADPDFVLNRPDYANAAVLITGPNFGCGSSREHAAWSLADAGFEALVAPSFAAIFENNCHQIGLLPVVLDVSDVAVLTEKAMGRDNHITIDLPAQTVIAGDFTAGFELPAHVKERFLNGWDSVDLTLRWRNEIEAYEAGRRRHMPSLS